MQATAQADGALAAPVRPDAAAAVEAYLLARRWLDAGVIASPEAAPAMPDVKFAGVVLRLGGRVVGMGKALGPEPGALPRALQQAATTAKQDAAVRALGEAPLARLTLDLEVGGQAQALVGGTFEEAISGLQPAMQGLALRHGERWAYMPVGHVLARGMAAPLSRSLLALVTELQIPPRDLPELRASASTAVYAVPYVRLAQAGPSAMPFVVDRLTPAIAEEPLGDADAARVALRIAQRLQGQVSPPANPPQDDAERAMRAALAKLGLRGTYDPLADEQREIAASATDQALCAYALALAAQCAHWSANDRASCRQAAIDVLRALEAVEPGEADPRATLHAAAFTLLALAALQPPDDASAPEPALSTAFEAALVARLQAGFADAPASSSSVDGARHAPAADAAAHAVALAALAARERIGTPAVPPAQVRDSLAAAWRALDRSSVLTRAPWLLLAERELLRADPSHAAESAARIEQSRALLDLSLAALVGTQRVNEAGQASAPDAWGAYPVADAAGARATAQTARPLHLAALMHAMCPSTTPDGNAAIERSMRCAARFLAQLQAGPAMDYALRTPERAHGGIMTAPYDPAMVPAAQGMTLLALLEMLHATPPIPAQP